MCVFEKQDHAMVTLWEDWQDLEGAAELESGISLWNFG